MDQLFASNNSIKFNFSVYICGQARFFIRLSFFSPIRKYFLKIVGIDNQYAKGKIEQGIKLINDLPYNKEI